MLFHRELCANHSCGRLRSRSLVHAALTGPSKTSHIYSEQQCTQKHFQISVTNLKLSLVPINISTKGASEGGERNGVAQSSNFHPVFTGKHAIKVQSVEVFRISIPHIPVSHNQHIIAIHFKAKQTSITK